MEAQKNMVVAVSYALEVEGQIADRAGSDKPLEYIHGTGMLLPDFEAAVEGKEPGEGFDFVLSPENGYGTYEEQLLVTLPKSAFEMDGKIYEELLVEGRTIPMYNDQGQVVRGIVKSVSEDSVVMDFNHPMAGKTLHFTGKVESVRAATDKELLEGLHGEYLPREGGCHCSGGCGGNCGGGCGESEGECKGSCEGSCHCGEQ